MVQQRQTKTFQFFFLQRFMAKPFICYLTRGSRRFSVDVGMLLAIRFDYGFGLKKKNGVLIHRVLIGPNDWFPGGSRHRLRTKFIEVSDFLPWCVYRCPSDPVVMTVLNTTGML